MRRWLPLALRLGYFPNLTHAPALVTAQYDLTLLNEVLTAHQMAVVTSS